MANRELYETLLNTRIGDYIIDEYIGEGGQAVVFRARLQQSGGKYALKVFGLLDNVSDDLEAGLAEATKQSQVDHSAVVKVFKPDIDMIEFNGEARRVLYVPMSYSSRGNCEKEPPFSGRPLKELDYKAMMNLLDGLREIHEAGLVHNDIKPANILKFHERIDGEERDNLRITDFGIAKVLEAIGVPSGKSGFTTHFMSPEQIDHRYSKMGDVYSMGATLYHMLTGEFPIDIPADKQDDLRAWQAAHRDLPRPDARSKNAFCPPRLALLIMRMMSVDPNDRPSLDQCIDDIKTTIRLLHGLLLEFPPPASLQQALESTAFPLFSIPEFRGIFKPEVHVACGTSLFLIRMKMRHPVLEQYKWLIRNISRQFSDSFSVYETWGSYDINMFIWSNRPEIEKLVRNLSQQFPASEPQFAEAPKIHHFHEKQRMLPDTATAVLALAVQEGVPIAGLDPNSYLASEYPDGMPEQSVRAFTYVEAVEDVNSSFFRFAIAEQVRNRLHELWEKRRDRFHRLSMLELAPNTIYPRLNATVVVVDFVASEYRYLPDVPTIIIESLGESAVRTLTCLETRRIMIQSDRILM